MATTARPLAKALHTVTSCARVAEFLRARGDCRDAFDLTFAALAVLGYTPEQIDASDPALFAACVAAVAKLSAPLLRSVA